MRPVGVDEEIALMHVGVKEAVVQGVPEKGLDQPAPERGRIEAEAREQRGIGHRRAVDPLHRQDFARRAVPVDLRRAKFGIVSEILGKFRRRRRLEAEIHLHPHGAGERIDDVDEPKPAQIRVHAFGGARGEEHVGDVALKASLDARAAAL